MTLRLISAFAALVVILSSATGALAVSREIAEALTTEEPRSSGVRVRSDTTSAGITRSAGRKKKRRDRLWKGRKNKNKAFGGPEGVGSEPVRPRANTRASGNVPVPRPRPFNFGDFNFNCEVRNLNDDGNDSLRDCIRQFSEFRGPSALETPRGRITFRNNLLGGQISLESPLFVTSLRLGSGLLLDAPSSQDNRIAIFADQNTIDYAIIVDTSVSFGIEDLVVIGGRDDTILMNGSDPLDPRRTPVFFTCEDSLVGFANRYGVALNDLEEFWINECNILQNGDDGFRFDLSLSEGEVAAFPFFGTVLGSRENPSVFNTNGRDGMHIDEGPGEVYIDFTNMVGNVRDGLYVADQTNPEFPSVSVKLLESLLAQNGDRDGSNLANALVEFKQCRIEENGINGVTVAQTSRISIYQTDLRNNGNVGVQLLCDGCDETIEGVSIAEILRQSSFSGNQFGAVRQSSVRAPVPA